MEITSDNLAALYYSYSKLFQNALENTESFWQKIAMEAPSSTTEERYPWMAALPRVQEWVGERTLHGVAARDYAIRNKKYELSIRLDRDTIEDNKLALFSPVVQGMGESVARWPDDMILELLRTATSALCWDGQAFFSDSHPVNPDDSSKGTFDNNHASTALTSANYQLLRQRMRVLKGENGRTLRITPNLLVVPPTLEATARQILMADFTAPVAAVGQNSAGIQQSNVLKGTAELLVIPDLEELTNGDTTWYLMDTTKALKPFIVQKRRAPEFKALDSFTDQNVIMRDEFIYASDMRGAAGFGLPQLCFRAIA